MLQEASRREFRRILIGTLILTALMLGVFFILHLCNVISFRVSIAVSALLGAAVAVLNFYGLCLGVQKSTSTDDPKRSKSYLQASYQYRLLFQAAWCIVAIIVSYFNPFAAIIPLLFPRIVILAAQLKNLRAAAQSYPDTEESTEESVNEKEDQSHES